MSTHSSSARLAVIDYGAGNLRSVVRALTKVGVSADVTSDPSVACAAAAVVFPGVGATLDTMQTLQRLGMDQAIKQVIQSGRAFLGICVGMQVLCEQSEEFGPHACLGITPGKVRRLPDGQKIPQIGWNQVQYSNDAGDHPLFAHIPDGSDFYFVHSFYCDLTEHDTIAGVTDYGLAFPSALIRDNMAAVQFHPEKSGLLGLQLLANFASWSTHM